MVCGAGKSWREDRLVNVAPSSYNHMLNAGEGHGHKPGVLVCFLAHAASERPRQVRVVLVPRDLFVVLQGGRGSGSSRIVLL